MPNIKISQHRWNSAPPSIKKIRTKVFVDEQSVPEALEWDKLDEEAIHFLVQIENVPIATARLVIDDTTGKIGRIAVLPSFRNKTMGSMLVKHVMRAAVKKGVRILKLSAQMQAFSFYQKLGFFVVGSPYEDAGIEHIDMENPSPILQLDPKYAVIEDKSKRAGFNHHFELNADPRSHIFTNTDQFQDLSRTLIGQARRRVCIVSQNLDRDIFDNDYICNAIHRIVRSDPKAEIKIWVEDDKVVSGKFHKLINLSQRLTSYVEIRYKDKGQHSFLESMILVDFNACLHIRNHKVHAGFANFNNRMIAERLYRVFDEHWQVAKPTMEMRRLAI